MLTSNIVTVATIIYLLYLVIQKARAIYNRSFIASPPKHETAKHLLFQRRAMIEKRKTFLADKDHYAWLKAAKKHMESD